MIEKKLKHVLLLLFLELGFHEELKEKAIKVIILISESLIV